MSGDQHSGSHEPERSRGQDRETEPIPRARIEANGDADTVESERYTGSAPVGPADDAGYDAEPEDEQLSFSEDEFGGLRGGVIPPTLASRRVLPLEEAPSRMIARYLFPSEKFRGEWKRHWIQIAKELLGIIVATVFMGYLAGLAAKNDQNSLVTMVILVWGGVMIFLAWRIADWYVDRFILTNKRVMVVKGLITRNVGMMPLLRVTDMKYIQSPLGRLLGYGHFELESAGQDQALRNVRNLPNPNELYLQIVEEMYEPEAVEARLTRGEEDSDGT